MMGADTIPPAPVHSPGPLTSPLMHLPGRAAVLAMLALLCLACERKPSTSTFDNGRLTATFPAGFATPKTQVSTITSEFGTATITAYTCESGKTSACSVAYADYPQTVFESHSVPQVLNDSRDGVTNTMKGNLQRERKWTRHDAPARTIYFTADREGRRMYGRLDLIAIPPRVYQILFMSTDRNARSKPEIDAFFDSVQIK